MIAAAVWVLVLRLLARFGRRDPKPDNPRREAGSPFRRPADEPRPRPGTCSVCGAAPGEHCDAGLHD